MKSFFQGHAWGPRALAALAIAGLLVSACAPAAPAPTSPAAKPTDAARPAQEPALEASPETQPAAKTEPAPAAKASPAAKPAEKPALAVSPVAGGTTAAVAIGKPLEPMQPAPGNVKQTIVMALGQNPDTLHPFIGSMLARSEVIAPVYTAPIRNDNRGEWVAIGVEQVPTFENGGAKWVGEGDDRHLEVTFKIKPGIKWHDGTPTTAKDMVYAWKLAMDPKFPAATRSGVIKYFGVDATDDQTVVAKFMSARQAREAAQNGHMGLDAKEWADYKDQRDPVIDPLYFTPPTYTIDPIGWLPEHVLSRIPSDQHETADYARRPLGNGPYRLVEWVPDQTIRLEAVDDYVLGKPPTKNLVFRIIPDSNAQIAAMRAGEIDVALQPNGPDVDKSPELDRLQGYTPHYIPGTAWEHIDLNMNDPVLQDKNVRKALMQSINREQIVERLLFAKTRVATSWIQPGVPAWAYDASCATPYTYDPAAAGRMLEQAGYTKGADGIYLKNGQPLRLKLSTTDAPLRKNVSQVIQANLKSAGIDLELDFIPGRGLFSREGPLIRGTFQLGLYTWISDPDPDATTLYHSKSAPTDANNFVGQNFPRYSNARFDDLATRGANTLEVAQRKQIYCDAVKLWTDDVPVIPLFQRLVVTVARSNLANFRPTPTVTPETWNAWGWWIPA
jgi:peptide/nickel transport system substrate-binding protein